MAKKNGKDLKKVFEFPEIGAELEKKFTTMKDTIISGMDLINQAID